MIYLSGKVVEGVPAMLTPTMRRRPTPGVTWAADTGLLARPGKHDPDRYLRWLASRPADDCLFATAPDVFGNGEKTLELSLPMLPQIRLLGYRAALVAQPGMTLDNVPWYAFDALFVGGPDAWQHSEACADLIHNARRIGLWIHVGRVNGWRRLRWAAAMGADSADGTFLAFAPTENRERLEAWLARLHREPPLVFPV